MTLLFASLLALLVGPLLVGATRGGHQTRAGLDGFIMVAIVGLLVIHVIPEAIAMGGWIAAVAAALGFLIPKVVEGTLFRRHDAHRHSPVLYGLALAGLLVHAVMDGAALLTTAEQDQGEPTLWSTLALGVILHRIPTGLAIWYVVRPLAGLVKAALVMGLVCLGTVGGFYAGAGLLDALPVVWVGTFQALVAGTFVHVVFHAPLADDERSHVSATVGTVLALVGLWWVSERGTAHSHHHVEHHHGHAQAGDVPPSEGMDLFVTMALESAPALVVAFIAAGLLRAFLKANAASWLARGNRFSQAFKGMAFGLPLPICSCGVVPLFRTLAGSGAPATASFAFLIATPELGLDALLLSLPLLGPDLMFSRLFAAVVVALVVGLVVGRFVGDLKPAGTETDAVEEQGAMSTRLWSGLKYGLSDLVDDTLPWIVTGLVIGALLAPVLDAETLTALPPWLELPLFAILGIPLYVCAAGATPIVAVLVFKGISPGAAIAFLLTGPATNVTTFGVLRGLYGRNAAMFFALVVTGTAIVMGMAVNLVFPEAGGGLLEAQGHDHGNNALEVTSLGVLALMLLGSLLRMGPRGFLGQILPGLSVHEHGDHCHGEEDASEHGGVKACSSEDPVPEKTDDGSCCH